MRMRHHARRPAIALLAIAVSGCSMTPAYVRPAAPVPVSWPVGDAYLRQSEQALPSITYRDVFRDQRLRGVIDRALANNRDLRIAAANIAATRAQYRIQRGALFPEIDAGVAYSHRDGNVGSAAGSGAGVGGGGAGGGVIDSFQANLGTTAFEIDLFGRIRSLTDAALSRYFAQEAGARATRLTLVGDVATAWLTYAADASLLAIARDTVASAQSSVRLTDARRAGGIAPRTDLRQAQQVLATAQADVATQTAAVAMDRNALELLVGAPVDPTMLPGGIDDAGTGVAEMPAGVDSGILLRRPDVVEAEYTLRAANAQIGAARAALFPRISLTALAGLASNALKSLFDGGAFAWSAAPSASYPIFRAGAGRAGVDQAQAQRDAAVASYEKTIQTAFREVADALAQRGTITERLAANRRFRDAAADGYRLADARYKGGIDTFLASLDAQRQLYSARRTLVQGEFARASNLVTLYRTLGGDSLLDVTPAGPVPVGAPAPR